MKIIHEATTGADRKPRRQPFMKLRDLFMCRRDERRLKSLPDHLLRDIGLSRCEADFLVRNGRWWKWKTGYCTLSPL